MESIFSYVYNEKCAQISQIFLGMYIVFQGLRKPVKP